jgi:hypothetical protein
VLQAALWREGGGEKEFGDFGEKNAGPGVHGGA